MHNDVPELPQQHHEPPERTESVEGLLRRHLAKPSMPYITAEDIMERGRQIERRERWSPVAALRRWLATRDHE